MSHEFAAGGCAEIPPTHGRALPTHTGHVTTVGRVLIRAVLAVGVTVAGPALRDAVAVVALEAGGLTGVINC